MRRKLKLVSFPVMCDNPLLFLFSHRKIFAEKVASVVEESILPVNSELTAVGYLEQHSSGKPEIRPVAHLPYFL